MHVGGVDGKDGQLLGGHGEPYPGRALAYKRRMPTALQVQLTDAAVGTVPVPRKWNNETQKYENQDPYETFVGSRHDFKDDGRQLSRSLFLASSEVPRDASMYHANYMEYLEKCWANHLGIMISPDILWFTLLNEVASLVRDDAKKYQHLFSRSAKKKIIEVITPGIEMPLGTLVALLRDHVPTDTALFLPEFTTSSARSRHAMYAAFCDVCSPFYDYMICACAFPAISITGTEDDWGLMASQWRKLSPLFKGPKEWLAQVQAILDNCVSRFSDRDWWIDMFRIERCGSGSDVIVDGWYSRLFRKTPGLAKPSNFPPCVATVDYKHMVLGANYQIQDGLFYSYQEGDFMIPDFGHILHLRRPVISEKYSGWGAEMDAALARFQKRVASGGA